MSNEFILSPKKSRRNKPTIEVGQFINTIHGEIIVLQYVNRTRVKIQYADRSIQPNPQWVTVQSIRKIEIKAKP